MRAIVLLILVLILCPVSLFNARIGIIAYVWFAIMRPEQLAWVEGRYPLSLALALCTLVGSIRFLPKLINLYTNRYCLLLLAFFIPETASVFTAVNPGLSLDPYWLYVRVIMMALLIPILIDTLEYLRWLLLVIAFSIGFLGFKFGLYGLLYGGVRYAQGYGGFMSDNNQVALALAMGIPLCWYAIQFISPHLIAKWWVKAGFLAMLFCTLAGIVWTYSRGGLLAAMAAVGIISWHSRHKVTILALLAIMALPAIFMVQNSYFNRIDTLKTISMGDQMEASAKGRLVAAQGAFRMWLDHPILGVGFGTQNCQALMSQYTGDQLGALVAHNTYLQVLADSGLFAFLLYCLLLFGTIFGMGRSAKRLQGGRRDLKAIPLAIQASLIAYAVGSTFLSRVSFDFFYFLTMAAASWHVIEKNVLLHHDIASAPSVASLPENIMQPQSVLAPVRRTYPKMGDGGPRRNSRSTGGN